MSYDPSDLIALKSVDTMQAYAEARLDGRTVGRSFRCACPWGVHHTPLKVEINDYHGEGRATCWACQKKSVKVFELASAVSGIPNDGEHFGELMRHVAEVTGYLLRNTTRRKCSQKIAWVSPRRFAVAGREDASAEEDAAAPQPVEVSGAGMDESTACLVWEAVERARNNPARLAELAKDLNLPEVALIMRTDCREMDSLGLIGLTPGGQLLFITTRRLGSEKLTVLAVKVRAPKEGSAPAEVIENGQWVTRGTLDASRHGGKFRACVKGAGAALWGADAIAWHDLVIVTEGESDKLAVDLSVDALREGWQTGLDNEEEYVPEHCFPAVVASPGCSAFKEEWAHQMLGKVVFILADADAAGEKGSQRVADILHAAGVGTVKKWTPQDGFKDARQQFDLEHPQALVEDIMDRSEEI